MLTLIVNPTAGSGYALRIEDLLRKELSKCVGQWEILRTEYPSHATTLAHEAAQRPNCQGVIAVGGDGTAYEVACGLLDSGVPLGLIPAGTGNDFIKTVSLPKKPMDALRFILTHTPRPVDIGRLNDRFFLNVCGTGFDVTVLDYAEDAKKYARGILPYFIGLVRAIMHYHPVDIQFTIDGKAQRKKVLICSVANGRYIGGGIPICPEAMPDDGLFDAVIVQGKPRWQIPFYLPGLMMGKITKFGVTTHVRCRQVSIRAKGMRLNVDGEILTMDRADFDILPGKLLLYW